MAEKAAEEVIERGWLDRVSKSVQSEVAKWPASHKALGGASILKASTKNGASISANRRSLSAPSSK